MLVLFSEDKTISKRLIQFGTSVEGPFFLPHYIAEGVWCGRGQNTGVTSLFFSFPMRYITVEAKGVWGVGRTRKNYLWSIVGSRWTRLCLTVHRNICSRAGRVGNAARPGKTVENDWTTNGWTQLSRVIVSFTFVVFSTKIIQWKSTLKFNVGSPIFA